MWGGLSRSELLNVVGREKNSAGAVIYGDISSSFLNRGNYTLKFC